MLYLLSFVDLKLSKVENDNDELNITDFSSICTIWQENPIQVETYNENSFLHPKNVVDIDSDSDFGMNSSIGSSVLLGTLNQEIIESITKPTICSSLWNGLENQSKLKRYFTFS